MPSTTTTYAEEQRPEESFAWTLLGHFLKYFCCGESLQESSPNRVPANSLAALRADSHLEKGRSPPRPLRPLGSGGTGCALRLVTCWSSDALRLSSSGRTGRQSAAESSCSLRFPCAFLLPWPEASRNTQVLRLATEPSSAPSVKRRRLSVWSTTPATTCA